MKKLSYIALAAVVGVSGFAVAPAFAAAGTVPMCNTSGMDEDHAFDKASDQLVHSKAFLGRTVQSVDQWNNCIKVIYQDAGGRSVTAFYDPDSLKLIDSMRNG